MIKNKIVVGILPTYDYSDNNPYGDIDRFIRMYEQIIYECGGIPIGLLNKDINIYKDLCDAYLWPGGNVINKEFYILFDDILKNKKPLLGVCLGSQAIATYFNVLDDQKKQPNVSLLDIYNANKLDNLYLKHLEEDSLNIHSNIVNKEEDSIKRAMHKIKINKNSFMYDIYGVKEMNVVSLHSYAIARTSNDILVSAKSLDGVIEAVEYHNDNNHILGIQYHPEVIGDAKPFKWLIENAYNKYKLLVNKEKEIPKDIDFKIINYKSSNPNVCNEENNLEEQTLYAFLKLKDRMHELGYNMDLDSGFRYHEKQELLFNQVSKEKGEEHANMYVAKPYHSEHETGLAVDVSICINDNWYNEFDEHLNDFYNVLHQEIAYYGFILRYPKDKEKITGYGYEPWHLRYVGSIEFAKYIMDNNLCLEEVNG